MQTSDPADIPPLAMTIKNAVKWSRFSRSKIYLLLGSGDIAGAKNGNGTLILMDSLRQFIASLPPFRAN